jgi:hypothetical protein
MSVKLSSVSGAAQTFPEERNAEAFILISLSLEERG